MCMIVGVLVGGCGHQPMPDSPAPSSGDRPVESGRSNAASDARRTVDWADDYCGAVTELVRTVSAMPTIDPSSAERASATSSALLDAVVGGLERTVDRLESLDPAPSDAAERVRASAVATYSDIRETAAGVKTRLDSAAGVQDSRAALERVNEPLDDIGELNLLDGFDRVPELARASRHAPACQNLVGDEPDPRIDPSSADESRDGGR
ncbi:hypothetical protein [Saccharomonospora saliphila]|uniref:hypothetical protein n=1 Tax=Saccharomonospora saliphila TaxID=369829 RepID=UPI0003637696|nr:hypothetical protein [Saccharomonospora saliphila]